MTQRAKDLADRLNKFWEKQKELENDEETVMEYIVSEDYSSFETFLEEIGKLTQCNIDKQLKEDKFSTINWTQYYCEFQQKMLDEFGPITLVSSGSPMFDHETYELVFSFEKEGFLLGCYGSYSSYDGTDFSDADYEEVIPKQVTVTQYEAVK